MTKRSIYFVRPAGQAGPVKIGCSTRPKMRFDEFNRSSPVPLELVATIPGDFKLESAIHNHLRESHDRLEWFKPTPEVTAVVDSVVQGTFDPNTIAPSSWRPRRQYTWRANKGDSMAREFIDELGGYKAVAETLKVPPGVVANWMLRTRAIPWRYRPALARIAEDKGVRLPEGFLDH